MRGQLARHHGKENRVQEEPRTRDGSLGIFVLTKENNEIRRSRSTDAWVKPWAAERLAGKHKHRPQRTTLGKEVRKNPEPGGRIA